VKFQLSRDTLEAMLRSMTYINEQLSSRVCTILNLDMFASKILKKLMIFLGFFKIGLIYQNFEICQVI
jgi:hypothetical protein